MHSTTTAATSPVTAIHHHPHSPLSHHHSHHSHDSHDSHHNHSHKSLPLPVSSLSSVSLGHPGRHGHGHDHHDDDSIYVGNRTRHRHWSLRNGVLFVRRAVRSIVADRRTRNVFFFLLLNLSFMVVEVAYGWWSNSLGLLGDGVHMFFDSSALIFSLGASVIAKWDATAAYSYGYGRVEILAGFLNCAALFMASSSIVVEACERLMEPPTVDTDNLLVVAVAGFIVNLLGIFAFDHGGMGHDHHHDHAHGGHHDDHHGHSHDHSHNHGTGNILLHGMFLHILADTLGSVGVILSSLAMQFFGWQWADPVCSLFIAALIFMSIWPLFVRSGGALLQRTPPSIDSRLLSVVNSEMMSVSGVLTVADVHFWEQASEQFVATARLVVAREANEQTVKGHISSIVKRHVPAVRWLTVQIDKDSVTTL